LKSALIDTAKAGWNSVVDIGNVGMFAAGIDSLGYFDNFRASAYDTPAFGSTMEVLLPFAGASVTSKLEGVLGADSARVGTAGASGVLETSEGRFPPVPI
jgi:hypothetical protein